MKKFLSLLLTLSLSASLLATGAEAKTFTDGDQLHYGEAVDVISALKVVDGYEDGAFKPQATLTRGAAAKIICNLILGPTTASALHADAAPYPDVPKDHTFAPYIAYCKQQGIISGYEDGAFRPAGTLSGYAFMKMLLGALGYDQKAEGYTGPNWSISVAKRALNLGLDADLKEDFNGVRPVNREEAALYAFNTLGATMVEYENTIIVDKVTIAASKAKPMQNTGKTEGNIQKDGLMQFAERHFPELKTESSRDQFGRPAKVWEVKGKQVGAYGFEAQKSYSESVTLGDIYRDLKLSAPLAISEQFVNGKKVSPQTLKRGEEQTLTGSGKGVKTEVFYEEESKTLIVSAIHSYVAEVSSVNKATEKEERSISLRTAGKTPGYLLTRFETPAFEKGQLVSYEAAWNESASRYEVQSVKALDNAIRGTLNSWKGAAGEKGSYFTLGGERYDYSLNCEIDTTERFAPGGSMADFQPGSSEISVYLDQFGNALYISGVEAEKKIAAVIGVGASNQFGSEKKGVTLLFPDGSEKAVTAKMDDWSKLSGVSVNPFTSSNSVSDGVADLVRYSVDAQEVYTLELLGEKSKSYATGKYDTSPVSVSTNQVGADNEFQNGRSLLELNVKFHDKKDFTTPGVERFYVSGETVFLVGRPDGRGGYRYESYVGYQNMPGFFANAQAGEVNGVAFALSERYGNQIEMIYLDVDRLSGIESAETLVVKSESDRPINDANGRYFALSGVVKGEPTTVKIAASLVADWDLSEKADEALEKVGKGFYSLGSVVSDSNGVITHATVRNAQHFDAANGLGGIVAPNKVVLGLGGNADTARYWAYDEETRVYFVEEGFKSIRSMNMNEVETDGNDLVFASLRRDAQRLHTVVILEQANRDTLAAISSVTLDGKSVPTYASPEEALKNAVLTSTSGNRDIRATGSGEIRYAYHTSAVSAAPEKWNFTSVTEEQMKKAGAAPFGAAWVFEFRATGSRGETVTRYMAYEGGATLSATNEDEDCAVQITVKGETKVVGASSSQSFETLLRKGETVQLALKDQSGRTRGAISVSGAEGVEFDGLTLEKIEGNVTITIANKA